MKNLLLAVIMSAPMLVTGQTLTFSSYNVEDGLVQSNVKSISQDRFGNLWLATSGGLSRFDGLNFTNFKRKSGLNDIRTLSVMEDRAGNIWIGTYSGLSRFDGKRFFNYRINGVDITKNRIISVMEDRKGTVWAISNAGGICRVEGESLILLDSAGGFTDALVSDMKEDKDGKIWISTYTGELYTFKDGSFNRVEVPGIFDKLEILSLFIDSKNRLWIGTTYGLYKMEKGKYERINEQFPRLDRYSITTMEEDEAGNLWLGTFTGALKYTLPGNSGKGTITEYSTPQKFTNNIVYDIYRDREGILWFGTFGNGFFKSMGNTFYHLGISHGLKEDHGTSILKVGETYWLGTYGGGIIRYTPSSDGDTSQIVNYTRGNGSGEDYVFCSLVDNNNNVWFGTINGLKKYDGHTFQTFTTREGLIDNWINAACKDKLGNLWFGTTGGLIRYDGTGFKNYSIGTPETDNWVRSLYGLSDNRLLLGTFGGLYVFDGRSFTKFFKDKELRNKNIFAFAEDTVNRRLWLGTRDEGIIKFDMKDGSIATFTESDGLTSDVIYSLIIGNKGHIFLGTQNGIDKLTLDADGDVIAIKNYNQSEGFSGIETNTNAVYKEKDGSIWFGSINGFFIYKPTTEEINTLEPVTHLTGIKLFYEEVDWEEYTDSISSWYNIPFNLALPYNQNHVSFEFIGHSLKNPKKVRYRYKLENFDKGWSPVTNSTRAVYANLPPGSYTFKLMAGNSDHVWNKVPMAYSFSIVPPFWMTWWFITLLFISSLVFLKLSNNYRVRKKLNRLLALEKTKIEAAEKIRKKVARDFHDEMGNHLVSISMLVQLLSAKLNNNGNGMPDLLHKLDHSAKSLFSGAKDFIWAIDPKNDGLYATVLYIKDFGEDLFDKTAVNFQAQTNDIYKSTVKLPPGWSRQIVLLFKEALTNCLKHADCRNVYMDFVLSGKTFRITLRDDGAGLSEKKVKNGVGMTSMRSRAREMAGDVLISSSPGSGTQIMLELKLP